MKKYIIYSCILAFHISCDTTSMSDEQKLSNSTGEVLIEDTESTGKKSKATLTFIEDQSAETIDISIETENEKHLIETLDGMSVQEIEHSDFTNYDIPSDATEAYQNYWSGVQTIYYLKETDGSYSLRKATAYEGQSSSFQFEEIFKLGALANIEGDFTTGVFEFVACNAEGDFIGLTFKNDKEVIEVWDAPNQIWSMYDWQTMESSLRGKSFQLKYDKRNEYLSKCELVADKSKNLNEFFIFNVKAVKNEKDAIQEKNALKELGHPADYLWIPDYNSLSGADYFSVYIGPYSSQLECENSIDQLKIDFPKGYGLLVSQENKRVQINGKGKVKVTEPNK